MIMMMNKLDTKVNVINLTKKNMANDCIHRHDR